MLDEKPLISIVIPIYNTPPKYLLPLIYSVACQTYSNWELILVNGSTDKKLRKNLDNYLNIDTRIKAINVNNMGISANTNEGIKIAKGEFIAFCDHDDMLECQALYEAVRIINHHPEVDVIYTDEDKISEDGKKYFSPHFKPDWSPDLLLNVNYITHFV